MPEIAYVLGMRFAAAALALTLIATPVGAADWFHPKHTRIFGCEDVRVLAQLARLRDAVAQNALLRQGRCVILAPADGFEVTNFRDLQIGDQMLRVGRARMAMGNAVERFNVLARDIAPIRKPAR